MAAFIIASKAQLRHTCIWDPLREGHGKSVYEGTWRKSSGNVRPALSPSRDLNANIATANIRPVYSVNGIFSIAGILELYKRKTRGLPGDPYFRDLTVVRNSGDESSL